MWAANKPIIEETTEELLGMKRSEVIADLTDRQITFCEVYTRTNNIRLAAKQAGYSQQSAHIQGWKTRQDQNCARYIAWLKARVVQDSCFKGTELLDMYMRIAFADITDFVEQDIRGNLKLKNFSHIDGQVVKKINHRAMGGVMIEMYDKDFALQKLEQYFEFMPKDWRQKIEERKVEILSKRLELEKLKAGALIDSDTDDGFIDAIRATAEEEWDDIQIETAEG